MQRYKIVTYFTPGRGETEKEKLKIKKEKKAETPNARIAFSANGAPYTSLGRSQVALPPPQGKQTTESPAG